MVKYKLDSNYWTNDFYDKAIDHIEKKYPIVVPSYNRYEDNYFLDLVAKNRIPDWPIFFVTRESQKDLYMKNYGDLPITFLSFKDEEINDIGKTRHKIIEYFTEQGYDNIFMLDDHCKLVTKVVGKNSLDPDNIKYKYLIDSKKKNMSNMFAMWQLTHDYLLKEYPGCWITQSYFADFIFDPKYGDNCSFSLGAMASISVCINLNKLKQYNLNYLSVHETGHEDIDLIIRAMDYKLYPIAIKYLNAVVYHGIESEVKKSLKIADNIDRVKYQNKKLYDMYKDTNPYVTLNKNDGLRIQWRRFFKDNNIAIKNGSIKETLYKNLIQEG